MIKFTQNAAEDIAYWKKHDPKVIKRIKALLTDIQKHPYEGVGKPEPLKHNLSGCWSRRITRKHRLVYRVEDNNIIVLQCRYHY